MIRGLFREENWAQVSYDGRHTLPITREQYESQEYEPAFDQLPERAEYEALLAGKSASAA